MEIQPADTQAPVRSPVTPPGCSGVRLLPTPVQVLPLPVLNNLRRVDQMFSVPRISGQLNLPAPALLQLEKMAIDYPHETFYTGKEGQKTIMKEVKPRRMR